MRYREPKQLLRPREKRDRNLISYLSSQSATRLDGLKEWFESAADREAFHCEISGSEKTSGAHLATSYFGTGNHLEYLRDWLYEESEITARSPSDKTWAARRWAAQAPAKADLLVADLPTLAHRLLPRKQFLECPAWLNQRLLLGRTWDEVKAKFRRSAKNTALRRIRKNDLQDRFTRDPDQLADFYHNMYRPSLERRFGAAAFIEPFERIRWFGVNGKLLQILRGERVIAAAILYGWGRTLEFLWVGLRGDLHDGMSEGAYAALYYFAILNAFEEGYDEVDFSGTRPLLNDGVYRFKRQWGAYIQDGWCWDRLLVRPVRLDSAVSSWLERSPMIVRDGKRLAGKVFFTGSPPTASDIRRIESLYASDGISRFKVASCFPYEPEVIEEVSSSEVEFVLESIHTPGKAPEGTT